MDPITASVVAAIAVGANMVAAEVGKQVIVDTYKSLKDLIKSKFGTDNKVSRAITDLEEDHQSKGRQMVLAEQMELQEADKNPDIVNLAMKLREALQTTDEGRQAVAKYVIDAKGAQIGVMGDHSHVEDGIHFGDPKR